MPLPLTLLKTRLNSFGFALNGVKALFKTEPNARIHLIAAILVVVLGLTLGVSALEWCILMMCIGAVLALEAINTAIEHLADYIQPERHEKIKLVKDLAAAGVLLTSIASAFVGLFIFIPKLITLW